MPCEFCNAEHVGPKVHEATGEVWLWDYGSDLPHKCTVQTVYCPACQRRMRDTELCGHYQKYNYKPGESETFIQKLIKQNYEPGSSMGWKSKRKSIGTSCGNTRTKNTTCTVCNKNLNGLTFAMIEKHKEMHLKQRGQAQLF